MKREIIGCCLIGIGVLVFASVLYLNTVNPGSPFIFSEKDMLSSIWKNYKKQYIEQGTGRALDIQQASITTTEGEGYALLRAVWMDDKATFDQSFAWASSSLKRPKDSLFSWLYGKKVDGTYGVLTDRGGQNTASDADTDIALSLIFAYQRWGDPAYLATAQNMISDIWDLDVVSIKGIPYLASDDLERRSSDQVVVNPSYFSPAAYKIFAQYDTTHPWLSLVDSSYSLLTTVTQSALDTPTSAAIPPDWVTLSKKTGGIIPNSGQNLTTNFSYDALRVPWRIALDYEWFGTDQSKIYLSRLGFLDSEWKAKGKLASVYGHDGRPVMADEVPAMYAGTLGYFMALDPASAAQIYKTKLLFLYDPDTNDWKSRLSYYDDNIVWFAIAMYNNLLPNLSKQPLK